MRTFLQASGINKLKRKHSIYPAWLMLLAACSFILLISAFLFTHSLTSESVHIIGNDVIKINHGASPIRTYARHDYPVSQTLLAKSVSQHVIDRNFIFISAQHTTIPDTELVTISGLAMINFWEHHIVESNRSDITSDFASLRFAVHKINCSLRIETEEFERLYTRKRKSIECGLNGMANNRIIL